MFKLNYLTRFNSNGNQILNLVPRWSSLKYSTKIPKQNPINFEEDVKALPPLNEPLPGLPEATYASIKDENHLTQVTTLANGLRVASENRFGQFCTVGVVIDCGSRYEIASHSGVSHFLEKLAFNSTVNFKSKDDILFELEKHGGICDCQSARDTFVYAASADVKGLPAVINVLSDVVLRPQITPEEIDDARSIIHYEIESLESRPEQEPLLMDMIHAAAFRDNTLGLPKICPKKNINIIDQQTIFTFLKYHFLPSRMVLAGVGVDHNELVALAQKYFENPIWEEKSQLINQNSTRQPDNSLPQYTGGQELKAIPMPVHAGTAGLPELSHVVLGLESVSHQDPDFIASCVLNMLMGGGGSFSAGGPGKGMYTRLYTNVLNKYHWMFSATAYNHSYNDDGLFCIHASSPPEHVKEMIHVLTREMTAMTKTVPDEELSRAKKQLQSMLLMNLEGRPILFEDIGRQVLATGERKRPEYFIKAIEEINSRDIERVAKRLLRSPASVAARGDLSKMPSLAEIQAALAGETKGLRYFFR